MFTTPLWVAAQHWSRSIVDRDSLWPAVDQLAHSSTDSRWGLRTRQAVTDGRR